MEDKRKLDEQTSKLQEGAERDDSYKKAIDYTIADVLNAMLDDEEE